MERRRLLTLALGGLASPLVAEAQPAGKVYRVAVISALPISEPNPGFRAFLEELRQLGYEDDRNVVLQRHSVSGVSNERYPEIAAEVVRHKPDVVVTVGNLMPLRVQEVAKTTPIVMVTSSDPVAQGLVQSLARPGGTVTGLTLDTGPEIEGKRLELLKSAFPRVSRVAFIGLKRDWEHLYGQYLRRTAPSLGVKLFHAETRSNDYREAFALIDQERPDALYVSNGVQNFTHRRVLVDFAARSRVPAIYGFRASVEAGGLMSYGPNTIDMNRRAAGYVARILKGAKPGDLSVEQPTKFELVINLKTAKALGLTIPPSLLLRADQVIE